MGFPCPGYSMRKAPLVVIVLFNILLFIESFTRDACSHLRILHPLVPYSSISAGGPARPSIAAVPSRYKTRQLPVILYRDFLKQYKVDREKDNATTCVVCLNEVDERHEIRELFNCSHVFHRDCLDSWVDEGQVSCPLCRTLLFPSKTDIKSGIHGWQV